MKINKVSFPTVVIATFHTDIVTHIKYVLIGFDNVLTEDLKNFKEKTYGDINDEVWTKRVQMS